jgi:[ribosomal protein S18]-alanine N-acetyltransferase
MNSAIRRMVAADVDRVFFIEQQCFSVPWSRVAFEEEIDDNPLAYYFVATVDDLVVGYAGMWIIIDEAHVTNVAVLPAYRGFGLGLGLMEALLDCAKMNGGAAMTLEVRESNAVALRLYSQLGFVPRGLRRHYYSDNGENAMIMWLDNI